MKVESISNLAMVQNGIDQVKGNLESLAKRHNVSVNELVQSAESAGANGPSYLVRAMNLKKRLDSLESRE